MTVDNTIVAGIASFLLGSGGIITYLKYFREGRTETRTFAENEREKMRSEIDILNSAISALSARVIPSNLPVWIKNADKKYIDVNPAWVIHIGSRVGKYKDDVLGKTDEEVFDNFPEFAKMLSEICSEAESGGGLAVRKGVMFPNTKSGKIIIKEILVHDILGQAIFKGMAVPDIE